MALAKNQFHFFTESAQMIKSIFSLATASAVLALVSISPAQAAVDADAAQALFKKNDCTKCHAVDKTKKGPSLQKIAAKYKGKAEGEKKSSRT